MQKHAFIGPFPFLLKRSRVCTCLPDLISFVRSPGKTHIKEGFFFAAPAAAPAAAQRPRRSSVGRAGGRLAPGRRPPLPALPQGRLSVGRAAAPPGEVRVVDGGGVSGIGSGGVRGVPGRRPEGADAGGRRGLRCPTRGGGLRRGAGPTPAAEGCHHGGPEPSVRGG